MLDRAAMEFQLADGEKSMLPLVRLRVDHGDFPTINNQRFGARLVQKLANPNEILNFMKKRQVSGVVVS